MKTFILKRRINRFLGKALIVSVATLGLTLLCALAAVNDEHVQLHVQIAQAKYAIAAANHAEDVARHAASLAWLASTLPNTALLPVQVAANVIPNRLPAVKPPVPARTVR